MGTPSVFSPVFDAVERLIHASAPVIIGIDGMCASGKSTLGRALSEAYDAELYHADDYFLPPDKRTAQRLSAPGGNMDRERLTQEVLLPISRGEGPVTRRFDCSSLSLEMPVEHKISKINIVEGSYSLHPDLCGFYTLKIALRTTPEVQLRRLHARAPSRVPDFISKWIPLENAYIKETSLYSRADMVIDT